MMAYCRVLSILLGAALAASTATAQYRDAADGVVVSRHEATLSSQIDGLILAIPFRDGEHFSKGDALVRFDCDALSARHDAQQAKLTVAMERLKIAERLNRLGAMSKGDLFTAQGDVKISKADLRAIDADLRGCKIKAPFDGRIVETAAEPYETVARTQELVRILDDKNLEIDIIVPSTWLKSLKLGQRFTFRVLETGTEYDAELSMLGSAIDPVSRTLRLRAEFAEPVENVVPGMSGQAYGLVSDNTFGQSTE